MKQRGKKISQSTWSLRGWHFICWMKPWSLLYLDPQTNRSRDIKRRVDLRIDWDLFFYLWWIPIWIITPGVIVAPPVFFSVESSQLTPRLAEWESEMKMPSESAKLDQKKGLFWNEWTTSQYVGVKQEEFFPVINKHLYHFLSLGCLLNFTSVLQ